MTPANDRPPTACPSWCAVPPSEHEIGVTRHESSMIWMRRPSGPSLSITAEEDIADPLHIALAVLYQDDDPLVMLSPAEARSVAAALVATADRIEGHRQ